MLIPPPLLPLRLLSPVQCQGVCSPPSRSFNKRRIYVLVLNLLVGIVADWLPLRFNPHIQPRLTFFPFSLASAFAVFWPGGLDQTAGFNERSIQQEAGYELLQIRQVSPRRSSSSEA